MNSSTIASIIKSKGIEKVVALAISDFPTAQLAQDAGIDLILVGDSLGMVTLGLSNTTQVDIDMIVHHTKAVSRSHGKALIAADLPFPGVAEDFEKILQKATQLLRAGAGAIKVEGGSTDAIEKIERLINAGIPIMGHLGLLPQQVQALGGYRQFGKTEAEIKLLKAQAKRLQEAGIFALVLEMVAASGAREITEILSIPTIGIGSGQNTDGQILVSHDLLGLTQGKMPSFVKPMAKLKNTILKTFRTYQKEVRNS